MRVDDQPAVKLIVTVLIGVDGRVSVVAESMPCPPQQMSFFLELRKGNTTNTVCIALWDTTVNVGYGGEGISGKWREPISCETVLGKRPSYFCTARNNLTHFILGRLKRRVVLVLLLHPTQHTIRYLLASRGELLYESQSLAVGVPH